MPQPGQVEDIAARMLTLYQRAQLRIDDELAAIIDNPKAFRRRARLNELNARIEVVMDQLDQQVAFLSSDMVERVYTLGGTHAQYQIAAVIAEQGGVFTGSPNGFNQINREAVAVLSAGLTDDLLQATRHVRRTTKALVRDFTREAVAGQLIEGRTAMESARLLARWLEDHKIHGVTYANGMRVPIGAYSEMAVRTVSAIAYNEGTFEGASAVGVEYFEVFDGFECGWTAHEDGEKANGTIRSAAACREYPISHPSCRRSFGPRPDVYGSKESKLLSKAFGLKGTTISRAKPLGSHNAEIQAKQAEYEQSRHRARVNARNRRLRQRQATPPTDAA